jgi:hypothetical protein
MPIGTVRFRSLYLGRTDQPPLAFGIRHVLGMGAEKEVGRIDTSGVVTAMADFEARRDRTDV